MWKPKMRQKSSLTVDLLIISLLSLYSIPMQLAEAKVTTIRVLNNLVEPGYPLGLRCKSTTGLDKKLQSLDLGQVYTWQAHPGSVWNCDFLDWNFREVQFSVYSTNFSQTRCPDVCSWSVRFNGFYFAGVPNPSPDDFAFFRNW